MRLSGSHTCEWSANDDAQRSGNRVTNGPANRDASTPVVSEVRLFLAFESVQLSANLRVVLVEVLRSSKYD